MVWSNETKKIVREKKIKKYGKGICEVCQISFDKLTSNHSVCSYKCHLIRQQIQRDTGDIKNRLLKTRFEIFKRDNFTCQYCGRNVKEDKIKLHVDHIIPLSKNGTWEKKNLTTACEECNIGKADILLNEYKIKKDNVIEVIIS